MGECLYLPLSSAVIMIIISAEARCSWLGQIKTKVLASQSLHWTLLLTEGVVSKQPPPYPTSFDPKAWSTHPLLGQSLGYPAVLTKTSSPLHFWAPGCAWRQAKTQWARFNEIRQIYIYIYIQLFREGLSGKCACDNPERYILFLTL